jgi:hypothetical protein
MPLNRSRYDFSRRHLRGPFYGWGYQDFTSATANVTISDNENGSAFTFDANDIVNSSAVCVMASDGQSWVYTGAIKLFSSKVTVSAHLGTAVTLSGDPHANYEPIRIYYLYKYESGMPFGYTIPSRAVTGVIFDEIGDVFVPYVGADRAVDLGAQTLTTTTTVAAATVKGGSASSGDLTLQSTSHATKGVIIADNETVRMKRLLAGGVQ